jgi:hypothetical protein
MRTWTGAAALLAVPLIAGMAHAAEFDIFDYQLQARDAGRFAELFARTSGTPSAQQLQQSYLDGSTRGVSIFTPGRIESAEHLAATVAKLAPDYRHAIDTCLPITDELTQVLRATYLAYHGLLPGYPLPQVFLVFGAGNSGGTAVPGAQVLGLEVACRTGVGPEQYRSYMRTMFAHETAHSWQPVVDETGVRDLLLFAALREGTPDYLAGLVTGATPSPEREAFARPQEKALWAQFQRDRQVLMARRSDDFPHDSAEGRALYRWFANYGSAPEGWPHEAGYWVGMQIAAGYVAQAPDKGRAIRDLLELEDPQSILAASGYEEGMSAD